MVQVIYSGPLVRVVSRIAWGVSLASRSGPTAISFAFFVQFDSPAFIIRFTLLCIGVQSGRPYVQLLLEGSILSTYQHLPSCLPRDSSKRAKVSHMTFRSWSVCRGAQGVRLAGG